MMGWMGSQGDRAADDSKVMEPPETPAPMFALRAFQSALFGTPKADEEDNTNTHLKPKEQAQNRQLSKDRISQKSTDPKIDNAKATAADVDLAVNAMVSPTKSILMTPGTVSNRRKTVSFGDGVVDNERKHDEPTVKPVKTPTPVSGNISSQWASGGSSDGKRSKLTQALMDSRERPSKPDERSQITANPAPKLEATTQADDNEDTINMNEPRSRSGKYWKAEFDSYRSKTALEIRRLIQYRSAAKTYAKKKDEEAYRLAAKLKEEEARVEEMERHVTQLASTMVAENSRADKEQLVQDLTKQTALALQYKHKVSLLRKALEQHGVVGDEIESIGSPNESRTTCQETLESHPVSKDTTDALQKSQQALAEANAKIEEMKHQQSDVDKLKGLAFSSEQKALELEKENAALKHTLARFKQEASKYEGRRKEREARLKQREAKLETRIQEYRERLKTTTQQHREQEESLKTSFDEERRQMQEQIDVLRTKLQASESAREIRARPRANSRKDQHGVQAYDFGTISPQKEPYDETGETEQPPSPSPRAKDRRSFGIENDLGDAELRKAMREMGIEDIDEKFNNIGISPLRKYKAPRYQEDTDIIPPSSPPEMSTVELDNTWTNTDNRRNLDKRHTYQPSHATTSLPSRRLHIDDSHQIQPNRLKSRRSATKYSLDALSSLPGAYLMENAKRRQSVSANPRDAWSIERKMAAQARLRRKDEGRKGRDDGKENHVRTAVRA
ncbi:spindle pole body formation-associated protein-domain-containing protein [Aspergillus filifer]